MRGLVQGVGFRPFVWRLATEGGLVGEVSNDAGGVLIVIKGPAGQLSTFISRLQRETPPLARIDAIEVAPFAGRFEPTEFLIAKSRSGVVKTTIVPDAATCSDCVGEVFDPGDRRFQYPFTNCTNCGPRLTITRALPYDRANTSMAVFPMCPACLSEYEDPANRRFHAQPNACPKCGPKVWLEDLRGERLLPRENRTVISLAADLIKNGKIVAIKGLGGFHLACDGASAEAVTKLRQRKRRHDKPLALMVRDFQMAGRYVVLEEQTRRLMASKRAPIILCTRKTHGVPLPAELAPQQNRLGLMLPYTPLHHLLMAELEAPIVLTSGNLSKEPQLTGNEEARDGLKKIADFWLMHDREIVNRLDDSVVQLVAGVPQILRRARGYAPQPLRLPDGFGSAPDIIALGGDIKNSFCLLKNGQAIVSQHIGDLQNPLAHKELQKNIELYCETNQLTPSRISVDLHPGYFSTRLGEQMAALRDCPVDYIQHHHAHIAASLAEQGIELEAPPVIGVVFDGLGYGLDDTLWGGEFFLADYRSCKRLAHFVPVALPGGDRATLEPWRNLFAHLLAAFAGRGYEEDYGDLVCVKVLREKPLAQLEQMIERNLNSPKSSSAGRLFDAVACALGLSLDKISFEGQAAMALQSLAAREPDERGTYRVQTGPVIGWKPLWRGLLGDLQQNVSPAIIAARFHNSLSALIVEMAAKLADENKVNRIVLSGGVFQNSLLLGAAREQLQQRGLTVFSPKEFPANDGGLSLGQAVISAARNNGGIIGGRRRNLY